MSCDKYEYLNKISSPEDVKALPRQALDILAREIREELVEVVSKNGGHLASNLGVVELTIALHRVFDSPRDHIIFDVGHQSYVHKMLTGRFEKIDTLRTPGGLCGFTSREESEHDAFGAGHSSTSLSAALGFAISDKLCGSPAYTVAVIGDGSYTGGMIHEALNNCRKDIRLIIIMNENEMSISKNIGRFAKNLAKIRNTSGYFLTKRLTGSFLKKIPLIGKWLFWAIRGTKKMIKSVLYGSNYFESMGLTYLGPIDGNNYDELENLLSKAKELDESVVIHIKTKKGCGYEPAEKHPDIYHGMTPANAKKGDGRSFSSVAGDALVELADKDESVCAITAAMSYGTGLEAFGQKHSARFFDVGIAEPHALTFSCGLCANGMKPYFAVYSSFLQRAYDNVIHDAALQKLPIKILVDRAGINDGDGATHHGIFDVAFLSQVPNIKIYTPITNNALVRAIEQASELDVPCAIRYPSGHESERVVHEFYKSSANAPLLAVSNFDRAEELCAVIITYGRIVEEALAAVDILKEQNARVGIILLEALKPYDKLADRVSSQLPENSCKIVFLEEGIRNGGAGMLLFDKLSGYSVMKNKQTSILAIDDNFVPRRSGEGMYAAAKIDARSIVQEILR